MTLYIMYIRKNNVIPTKNSNIMKKILTFALMALLALPSFAGKAPKNWNFTLNDDGECIVEKVIPTDKSATDALKAVKVAVNKQTFENRSVKSEEAGSNIVYELTKNTKMRYSPFAGNFNESMSFKMEVVYADGKITVRLSDMTLINKYEGFGKSQNADSFSGKIAEYEEAEQTAVSGKGKAKKEAADLMEDINESFNNCQEEIDKLFAALVKALK